MEKQTVSVQVEVNLPVQEVWKYWTGPQHIIKWNQPTSDWKTTRVENDCKTGGSFLFAMESEKEKIVFDYKGVYDEIIPFVSISAVLDDGRITKQLFSASGHGTTITEIFEPDAGFSAEDQQQFSRAVLETFKQYAESQK